MEPNGAQIIDHISDNLKNGKKYLYSLNRQLSKTEFDTCIEFFYTKDKQDILDTLLPLYRQLWLGEGNDSISSYEFYQKLENNVKIIKEKLFDICWNCKNSRKGIGEKCDKCSSNEILTLSRYKLPKSVIDVIKNGQYLEIYCKYCLRENGVELIGWADGSGNMTYNSINY